MTKLCSTSVSTVHTPAGTLLYEHDSGGSVGGGTKQSEGAGTPGLQSG